MEYILKINGASYKVEIEESGGAAHAAPPRLATGAGGKKVKFVETTLRDGQQCLIATRMRIQDMIPILATMDRAGFHAVEVWGGATFDAAMRFLKEDPWERLRVFRQHFKNTKLQMLFRGQNVLGYKSYHNEVVDRFLERSIANGIDIIRIFDALNDTRNLESSVEAIRKYGGHAQLALCYTISDVHTVEYFVGLAKDLENMGAHSLVIKDMAGLLNPATAYDLVKGIKETCKIPLEIHTHCTSGMADMVYLKAVEAGVDIINTATSPFALGASQPSTEVMNAALKGLGYATDLDQAALIEIARYFRPLRETAIESGLLSHKVLGIDVETFEYQVPGGMLSNLVSQLKDLNASDKFEQVLQEMPRVRADLGYVPLVTPSSQIVGTQAAMNVIAGERYKMVTNETKDLVRGKYGRTAVPISDEIRKKIIGDEAPITLAPSQLAEPALKEAEEKIKAYIRQPEDVLSYVMFPQVAEDFFKFREEQAGGGGTPAKAAPAAPVSAPRASAPAATPAAPAPAPAPAPKAAAAPAGNPPAAGSGSVEAPMPGKILTLNVKKGDVVTQNQVLCILEAMKMENEICSPVAGTVSEVHVTAGEAVDTGKLMFTIA